jgi:RNA polymerase sigma-70 factor (ECF subfamily)
VIADAFGRHGLDATDLDLLAEARAGNASAFEKLIDRHADALFGLAVSMVKNRADAEELVQETFAAAFTNLEKFQGRAAVKTWICSILVNRAISLRRRERIRQMQPLNDDNRGFAGRQSGDHAMDAKMDVHAVLQRLSEEHRQVIVLRELHGLSYEEIAETVGIPRGTVESRLHRARNELREMLKEYQT